MHSEAEERENNAISNSLAVFSAVEAMRIMRAVLWSMVQNVVRQDSNYSAAHTYYSEMSCSHFPS